MKQGLAGALAPQQQAAQPQQVQQAAVVALKRMTILQHVFAGVHNEATFKQALTKLSSAGGQPPSGEEHYNKAEVEKLKKDLAKGIQHLKAGLQQGAQPQAMQQPPAAPQPSSAPAPQQG